MVTEKKVFLTLVAVAVAAAFGISADASAATKKKKVSYEQASKLSKEQLDKEKIPGVGTQANERYPRGGACMKKFGYKF